MGIPHAAVMHIKGFCLEDRTHDIPANATDFFVSTDNMGGLVCAITY